MANYSFTSMELGDLYSLRQRYAVYPTCQREKVWSLRQKQLLIDTALRRLPIPPIAYVAIEVPLWGTTKELVDGQQRFETFMEYLENGFPTAKNFSMEEGRPLYPNRYFRELDIQTQTDLQGYLLPVLTISEIEDSLISLMFRRWQGGTPLTLAEKLFSFEGEAKEIAKLVARHRFWQQYSGRKHRKEPYQFGVKLILMETAEGFANLTSPRQTEALTRKSLEMLSIKKVEFRMDCMCNLFDGSDFTSVNQATAAYQCIYLLDQAGYRLSECPPGILTNQFMKIKETFDREKRERISGGWLMLDKVVSQREFWQKYLRQFEDIMQPWSRDGKRGSDYLQKLVCWNRQNGICTICDKPVFFKDAVVDHVVPHANGGKTEVENLQVVHCKCHQLKHNPMEAQSVISDV